jgi:hypothetical protein
VTPDALLPQLLGPYGLVVGLLVVVFAFVTERVYTRGAMLRERRKTEYWRQLALSGTSLAQRATRLAAASAPQETPM